MLTVVTGWSPSGWKVYGEIFLRSFCKHWPVDTPLVIYVEEISDLPSYAKGRPIEQRWIAHVPGALWALQHYDTPTFRGLVPTTLWKERALKAGYNWRWDAWKFCRQGLIPLDAAKYRAGGLLLWLDGDVVTTNPVPPGFIEKLLPPNHDMAYLGREPKHSEIGFQLYRIPEALPVLQKFSDLYTTGSITAEKEWHSAYAFDLARKRSPEVRGYNMTPGGSGHVWTTTVLQRCLVHNKGDLKIDAQKRFYAGAP